MKRKFLIPLLTTILVLTACGKDAGSDPDNIFESTAGSSAETSAENSNNSDSPDSMANAEPISENEMNEFNDLFSTPEYIGFLKKPFNDPSELDWDVVLESGGGIIDTNISQDEIDAFVKEENQERLYANLWRISKKDLDSYAKSHTGESFDAGNDSFTWRYLEQYDSYYIEKFEMEEPIFFTCVSGEKSGNEYSLRFTTDQPDHYGYNSDRIINLTKDGDSIIVRSNSIQWEENCNPDQTFDVELVPGEGPVRFISYPGDAQNGVGIAIVKDGKLITSLSTFTSRGDNWGYFKKLNAVGFFDFNADGVKDIAMIGETDFGTNIILAESVPGGSYEDFYDVPEKIEEQYGDSVSIPQIKSFLMGDNTDCTFGHYEDAYEQIANLYHIGSDDVTFDLIYVDDDDIPELVAGKDGYYVSLYTFKDGHAHCYMHHWAYGAMGNAGYYYSPRKNVFHNTNCDYAGAIQYETFMSIREDGELEEDLCAKYIWFQDTDGDGAPSEDEEMSDDYTEPYGEYYTNLTGKDMTTEEIKAEIERLESLEFKEVHGSISYEELCGALGVR